MRDRSAELWCAGLLAVGLGVTVVDRGGQDLGAWDVCLLIIGLTAISYWLLALRSDSEYAPVPGLWLRRASFLLPAYIGFQLTPLPLFWVRILSPARAQLVDTLSSVLPAQRFAALSIASASTAVYLLRIIGYTVVLLLVRELTWRSRGRWRWALFAPLVAIAAGEAALGLSQIAPESPAHGTYGNRNHFAGLLEMALPGAVGFGLALRGVAGIGVLCLAALIFLGILFSLSKMGFVAAIGGLFVMGALGAVARLTARNTWLAVAGLVCIALLAVVFLSPDQVINGIGAAVADGSTGEGRFPIWADTLHLVAAYPLFGVGLGNYGASFLKYQTAVPDRTFDHAHNDYLEFLVDLGVLGYLLLAVLVFLIFRKACVAARFGQDPDVRYLGLGCAGGIAAIGFHSLADYNMYIPANGMVFAWISGIAAGLPSALYKGRGSNVVIPSRAYKQAFVVLSGLVAIYASGWLLLQHSFLSDPQAENWFCRFGICNMNGYLFGGDPDAIPQSYLLESLRRYPASPDRWSALGKAMWRSGQIEQARQCFLNAIAAGPNRLGTLFTFADFYHSVGEDDFALAQISRALKNTQEFDKLFFDWFKAKKISQSKVLAEGLPAEPRVFRNYLRYLLNSKDTKAAQQVWNASIKHSYVDETLASEYINFLAGRNQYESAARAWADYLGDRKNGYLESNWLLNGDFESEPSQLPLDWTVSGKSGVAVTRDADVKHSGAFSLRIRFDGTQNVSDTNVGETVFAAPGRYVFEAFLKSQDLTTDQGISLRVFDSTGASHLDAKTKPLLGTHDWTKVDLNVCVPVQTRALQIRVFRQPSLKFDNLIKGTLWLDSVSLTRVGQNCVS